MDVKDLVNSNLFYPKVWERYTIFSDQKELTIVPYNNDLEDLEFDDPDKVFSNDRDPKRQGQTTLSMRDKQKN